MENVRSSHITRLCAALILCLLAVGLRAQYPDRAICIQALDGRNGQPIRETHLLVFAGSTVEELRQHSHHFDLQTDQSGKAKLVLASDSLNFVQVWVDGKTLCQSRPNSVSLSVQQVLDEGLLAPNDCGALRVSSTPGKLLIFARPANLRESMAR